MALTLCPTLHIKHDIILTLTLHSKYIIRHFAYIPYCVVLYICRFLIIQCFCMQSDFVDCLCRLALSLDFVGGGSTTAHMIGAACMGILLGV